ncbi:hypothetical protein CBS101457_002240 [Exobasidium rhododendri]|nr:hypothetical protein CBS101457_002240 [Exobasidium rhododendri]
MPDAVLQDFSIEPAGAYDASRVPCLTDRDDINTTTNIYVNNLPSHTTDDDLHRLGSCFGPVKSHKAIINQETGLCKGYGFVMYEHPLDAETALQQLPLHGLTTSWAKESFSTKLRKLSDNTTSNVYVSNLPLDMTPHQLEQLFAPHLVVSLRILLDDSGASRGVGFVRLRDRDIAQECIDKLHGKIVVGQTTPLQARFADSEAQKRLKQSVGTGTKATSSLKPTTSSGLLEATSFVDPLYLASLQHGLQNWAGFGTPQNSSTTAAFVSPPLGVNSPGFSYAPWSPNMAAANWNLLNSEVYNNPLLYPNSAAYGLNYANSLYSPSSMTTSINSPFAPHSNKSLSPLSFTSTPLSGASPVLGKVDSGSRPGSTRSKPTYLPPDVHQQHAKALLEAQAGLTFDSPQAEAFGLSQLLLNKSNSDLCQQAAYQSSLYYNGNPYLGMIPSQMMKAQAQEHLQQQQQQQKLKTTLHPSDGNKNNALGMTDMTPRDSCEASTAFATNVLSAHTSKESGIALPFVTPVQSKTSTAPIPATTTSANAEATLSPMPFSLSTDPGVPITAKSLDEHLACVTIECKEDGQGMPIRTSTPMPNNDQGAVPLGANISKQESVTEEGDSLVIDSGSNSAIASFSSFRGATHNEEGKGLTKSDSGKIFDAKCPAKAEPTTVDLVPGTEAVDAAGFSTVASIKAA